MIFNNKIIIIALLAVVFTPVDQKSIYLHPKDSTRPSWCRMSDCYTFETFINKETLGKLSNTTLFLLPGTHTIRSDTNKIVSFTSITNFTLSAANMTEGAIVTINCSGNIGFKFTKVFHVEISGIIFDNCGTSVQTNDRDSDAE